MVKTALKNLFCSFTQLIHTKHLTYRFQSRFYFRYFHFMSILVHTNIQTFKGKYDLF